MFHSLMKLIMRVEVLRNRLKIQQCFELLSLEMELLLLFSSINLTIIKLLEIYPSISNFSSLNLTNISMFLQADYFKLLSLVTQVTKHKATLLKQKATLLTMNRLLSQTPLTMTQKRKIHNKMKKQKKTHTQLKRAKMDRQN